MTLKTKFAALSVLIASPVVAQDLPELVPEKPTARLPDEMRQDLPQELPEQLPEKLSEELLEQPAPAAQTQPALPSTPADFSKPDLEMMVPVEGGKVWVRVNGDIAAGGAPVVFIHGGPGGTHTGFARMLSLADSRAVILYDQLGSGKSERPDNPANWRPERFVAELEAIRTALGVDRWHVVGHSWGAAVALEYSAAFPQHTTSTVLGGTYISTARWIADTNQLITNLPKETQDTIRACESDTPPEESLCDKAEEAFYSEYVGRADAPPKSDAARAYEAAYRGQGFNPVIYNAMWGPSEFTARGSLINYDATRLLAELDGARTLFLVGQYDEARIDTVQDYVQQTPGAELGVVPGGSHAFPLERPDVTEAIIRSWLARKDQPRPEPSAALEAAPAAEPEPVRAPPQVPQPVQEAETTTETPPAKTEPAPEPKKPAKRKLRRRSDSKETNQ